MKTSVIALGVCFASAFAAAQPQALLRLPLEVGPRETVVSKERREAAGLRYWPDGTMGVLRSQKPETWRFFTANGGKIASTLGSLDNPVQEVKNGALSIKKLKQKFDYAAGGPLYRDKETGGLLLFYHAERWPKGDGKKFYASIGMARSTDDGKSFRDLGEIVRPNLPFDHAASAAVPIGGNSYLVVGDYLYVYFRDTQATGGRPTQLAVARATLADVVKAAFKKKRVVPWTKYFLGDWTEPGLGGRSSPLEPRNRPCLWQSAAQNETLDRYLMVCVDRVGPGHTTLVLMDSRDGLAWSSRQLIESDPGESFYPTLVGLGDDPEKAGSEVYLYYSYSLSGGMGRSSDAILARRRLSFAVVE